MYCFTFFLYVLITLPSLVYHSVYNLYVRLTHNTKYNDLPKGVHDVIVFIHGRGGHYTNFLPLMYKLQNTSYKLLAFDLGNNCHNSIQQDVECIYKQLNPLMDQISNIILVGLSKGGLTAIEYTLTYPNKIKMIITVSSPLNGTYVASYQPFCNMTRKELGYKSPLTEQIKEKSKDLNIFSIVPLFDHLIIPPDSARFPHSECYFYEGYYSHSGIIHAPEVIQAIIKRIKSC
jgi:pimeloyl-ACP methyl ester carboxylesterase